MKRTLLYTAGLALLIALGLVVPAATQNPALLFGSNSGTAVPISVTSGGVVNVTASGSPTFTNVTATGQFLAGTGTTSAPAYSFSAETTTGWNRTSSGVVRFHSNSTSPGLEFSNNFALASGGNLGWYSGALGTTFDAFLTRAAAGVVTFNNSAAANGIRLQFNGAAAIASGFGTSPAITSGSTDTAGEINVGTGGTATSGVINFASTWASAPFCMSSDVTTSGKETRATSTTTQLTLTTGTAWAASDKVHWLCIGSK